MGFHHIPFVAQVVVHLQRRLVSETMHCDQLAIIQPDA